MYVWMDGNYGNKRWKEANELLQSSATCILSIVYSYLLLSISLLPVYICLYRSLSVSAPSVCGCLLADTNRPASAR